jgi:surfactin synthase thioesterase subunit
VSDWLVRRTATPPARARLYAFPHSGGSTGEYVRWANGLPGVEVCVVQLPGRGARHDEPPYTRMEDLVGDLLEAVEFHPPFVLFGHSLGALVAYEVAQELRDRSRPAPHRVVVSAYNAPHVPRSGPRLHELPDGELLPHLLAGYGDMPAELLADEEYLADVLGCYRADLTVAETHVHARPEPLDRPVTVVSGLDDDGAVADLLAWREHTTGRFEVHLLPGGHFYLRAERDAVLTLVTDAMARP